MKYFATAFGCFLLILFLSIANSAFALDPPVYIQPISAKVLTANVGNADLMNCGGGYFYKLCQFKYERFLTQNIAAISPDIAALQEVFDTKWCAQMPEEKKKTKVCYKYKDQPEQQVRRLLGDNYTIVCDGRSNFECIGIKKDFAEVEGCEKGALCMDGRGAITDKVPEGCDDKAVIFGINIVLNGRKLRVVNGHPSAADTECRAGELMRMFAGYDGRAPLAATDLLTLAMGDMNMDPFRDDPANHDISAWSSFVGDKKGYYYLNGMIGDKPPLQTEMGRTFDQMITNFATGKCQTLGETEGTKRLDGVEKDAYNPEANDHRAVLCYLPFTSAERL